MKNKTCLMALVMFVLSSPTSFAVNWVFVASGDSNDYGPVSFYIDMESIRPHGTYSQAWVMVNLKTPATSGDKVMSSIKYQYLFDLVSYMMAVRQTVGYSRDSGNGEIVARQGPFADAQLDWADPVAGSYSDYLIKIVQKNVTN